MLVAGNGAQFKGLEEKVELSTATLTKRLNTARRYSLLEKEQRTDSDRNVSIIYAATEVGHEIFVAAHEGTAQRYIPPFQVKRKNWKTNERKFLRLRKRDTAMWRT